MKTEEAKAVETALTPESQLPKGNIHHKKGSKLKTLQPNSKSDSMTNVHFSEYIETEWKSGKRLPISIRINSELYKEFKEVSKRLYGSTCRAVENLMAVTVLSARKNVHFSNTQNTVRIGELHIERPVRVRRYLPVQEIEKTTVTKTETVKKTKVRSVIDYSQLSLEKLDHLYKMYKNLGEVGRQALVYAELKNRGFFDEG
jgi:hypothetical protein